MKGIKKQVEILNYFTDVKKMFSLLRKYLELNSFRFEVFTCDNSQEIINVFETCIITVNKNYKLVIIEVL